jgi:2-oxoglutarate/2-oxoacid ferredoxin oxidoreductase subunit beta
MTAIPPLEKVAGRSELLLSTEHSLCPGCGEPLAMRTILELVAELDVRDSTICVCGIGCYTAFPSIIDVDVVQALHGRAPSVATGVKRVLPDRFVFTLQGDGDMVNEGLQEIIHCAARGERFTAVLLNNGVFGETGGHMTATTAPGQRTKNTLEGRDPARHGHPIRIGELLAQLDGTAYAARGSVHDAAGVAAVRRMLRRALETQERGEGFSFVEVLTMCPTGWFVKSAEGPGYLDRVLGALHVAGELKADGLVTPTAELRAQRQGS